MRSLLAAALVTSLLAIDGAVPPLYRIDATSYHDAGLQHGRLAAERIHGWFSSAEIVGLVNFTASGRGKTALQNMKRDNTRAFPDLASELDGIALGAGVPTDTVWVATLIGELESLQPESNQNRTGHCSDIYGVAPGGSTSGFAHGHNEDWPGVVSEYWYFVAYTAASSNFTSCAGFVYPGSLMGWAATWNADGMYLTQNSLFPLKTRHSGLGSAFVQRDAICGAASGARHGIDHVVSAVSQGGWSSGASINLVDLKEKRMVNVETHQDAHATYEVPTNREYGANYSHFNMYKELEVGVADAPNPSTLHRQARVNSLAPPNCAEDIRNILSDTADTSFPVFRNMTLATLILEASFGILQVWCCGKSAAGGSPPAFSWDLAHFF